MKEYKIKRNRGPGRAIITNFSCLLYWFKEHNVLLSPFGHTGMVQDLKKINF